MFSLLCLVVSLSFCVHVVGLMAQGEILPPPPRLLIPCNLLTIFEGSSTRRLMLVFAMDHGIGRHTRTPFPPSLPPPSASEVDSAFAWVRPINARIRHQIVDIIEQLVVPSHGNQSLRGDFWSVRPLGRLWDSNELTSLGTLLLLSPLFLTLWEIGDPHFPVSRLQFFAGCR